MLYGWYSFKVCCVCNRLIFFDSHYVATNPIDGTTRLFYHDKCYSRVFNYKKIEL